MRAVKEAGGIILVQDPNEAEYASMPRSAIATGCADFVLPVRDLAKRLVDLIHVKESVSVPDIRNFDEELLRRIIAHLRVRTGHDFSKYKRSTVLRRIARRMQVTREAPSAPAITRTDPRAGTGHTARPHDQPDNGARRGRDASARDRAGGAAQHTG